MLEHAVDPPPEQPSEPTAGPPAADYYIPPHRPEPLTGNERAPRVKRFNRKMLAAMVVIGGGVVGAAFYVGLQSARKRPAEQTVANTKPPTANEHVNALPADYSDGIPQLGDPRLGELGAMSGSSQAPAAASKSAPHQLSPLEQYAQQAELDRLRNEDRARTATVSFANAGGTDASAGMPSTSSAGDIGQNFQERLLDLAERHGAPSSSVSPSARDDANRQDDKAEFAERPRGSDFQLHAHLQPARSSDTLFAGTILPCVLTQGINSDLPGQIGCMISQNVYDTVTGQHLLVPQGTKVIGTYDSRVAYGQERVLVVWTRLLRPDGGTLSLEGMPGVDLSGYAGLTGDVNNHYLRLLSGVVLGSLIGASAQIAVGANSQNPTFAQLAIQGAGQNINEAGQQITRKNLSIQPTIEVRPGSRLNIFATKDIILPPWTE